MLPDRSGSQWCATPTITPGMLLACENAGKWLTSRLVVHNRDPVSATRVWQLATWWWWQVNLLPNREQKKMVDHVGSVAVALVLEFSAVKVK